MSDQVVVRFAPSPTGPLHIGGVRTALYNYLFACKHHGRYILRLEDTDRLRFVEGAESYIVSSLDWLGIKFTEGVHLGGEYGPYRQSERKEQGIYQQYVDHLLESGHAYLAFDTPAELDEMRERLKAAGSNNLQYNYITRSQMKNSLTLPADEVKARVASGVPYVVRMKMPRKEEIRFQDVVRNWVVFQSSQLDDKVLLKSDGMPTYHLANVVDDHLMGVTHVIRGEEWLSSTPLHVMLYRTLGWEDTMPVFVHLPLILNPNGEGKMSKRQGDKMGFSVFPTNWIDPETGKLSTGYREDGYLADALVNFLALQGWSPGNDEEVMNIDRLIELFSLEKINNSATNFDIEKLKWFNETYIRSKKPEELLPVVEQEMNRRQLDIPEREFLLEMIVLLQERVTVMGDFVEMGHYFLEKPTEYDEKMSKKRWKPDSGELMMELKEYFDRLGDWNTNNIQQAFDKLIEEKNVVKGKVLAPFRLVLTGVSGGPGVFDIAALLGKEETLQRIERGVDVLDKAYS